METPFPLPDDVMLTCRHGGVSPRAGVAVIDGQLFSALWMRLDKVSLKQSEWECSKVFIQSSFIFPMKAETAAGILFSAEP